MKKIITFLIAFIVSFSFVSVDAADDQEVIITDSGQIHVYEGPSVMSFDSASNTGLTFYWNYSELYSNGSTGGFVNGTLSDYEVNRQVTLFSDIYPYAIRPTVRVTIPIKGAAGDDIFIDFDIVLQGGFGDNRLTDTRLRNVYLYVDGSSTYSANITDNVTWDSSTGTFSVDYIYETSEQAFTDVRLYFQFNNTSSAPLENLYANVINNNIVSGSYTDILLENVNNNVTNLQDAIAELTELVESQDRDYTEILEAILQAIDDGNTQVTNAIISMMNLNESRQIEIINKLGEILSVEVEQKNLLQLLVDFFYNNMTGAEESQNNALDKADELTNQNQQLEQIEQSTVQDFNNNISNLDTNLDLFSTSDFVSSANFLATNMTRLVQTNSYIQYMITFSLIIGFALVLIGRGLK